MSEIKQEHKRYCPKCGYTLRYRIRRSWYDFNCGSRRYSLMLICPLKRHWWDGHFKSDFDGEGYDDFDEIRKDKLVEYGLAEPK